MLHLRGKHSGRRQQQRRRVIYPIRSNRPDRIVTAVIREMTNLGVGHDPTTQSWDTHIAGSCHCIKVVAETGKVAEKTLRVQSTKAQPASISSSMAMDISQHRRDAGGPRCSSGGDSGTVDGSSSVVLPENCKLGKGSTRHFLAGTSRTGIYEINVDR